MGESTVSSLLSEFKSGNRKVADFVEETIEKLMENGLEKLCWGKLRKNGLIVCSKH